MTIMARTLKLRVRELLDERGWGAMDLIRMPQFEFSPGTAYRLAANDGKGLTLLTMSKLSEGFDVPIDDLFVREEEVVASS